MLESREWRGLWWDPRKPDTSVAGILTFSQSDAELELIGVLPDLTEEDEPLERVLGLVDRPRIFGFTTDGKKDDARRLHPTRTDDRHPRSC